MPVLGDAKQWQVADFDGSFFVDRAFGAPV